MRISDWSSDVCSSDLVGNLRQRRPDLALERRADRLQRQVERLQRAGEIGLQLRTGFAQHRVVAARQRHAARQRMARRAEPDQAQEFVVRAQQQRTDRRSEEHTSELQSLMRISYAVFCLKKKTKTIINQ